MRIRKIGDEIRSQLVVRKNISKGELNIVLEQLNIVKYLSKFELNKIFDYIFFFKSYSTIILYSFDNYCITSHQTVNRVGRMSKFKFIILWHINICTAYTEHQSKSKGSLH